MNLNSSLRSWSTPPASGYVLSWCGRDCQAMAKIIVIDDDRRFLRAIRRMLEASGHTVIAYEDGRPAIAQIGNEIPDLLITDVFMPEMEGLETIRRARAISSILPIIAISGRSITGVDYLQIARHFGASATLAKPFRRAELVGLISRLLPQVRN
jgi:CheY-like chemotaxis protein